MELQCELHGCGFYPLELEHFAPRQFAAPKRPHPPVIKRRGDQQTNFTSLKIVVMYPRSQIWQSFILEWVIFWTNHPRLCWQPSIHNNLCPGDPSQAMRQSSKCPCPRQRCPRKRVEHPWGPQDVTKKSRSINLSSNKNTLKTSSPWQLRRHKEVS